MCLMSCSINVAQALTAGLLGWNIERIKEQAGKRGKDAAQVFPCSVRHLQDMLMSVLYSIISDGFV